MSFPGRDGRRKHRADRTIGETDYKLCTLYRPMWDDNNVILLTVHRVVTRAILLQGKCVVATDLVI